MISRPALLIALMIVIVGCSSKSTSPKTDAKADASPSDSIATNDTETKAEAETPFVFEAQAYEASAEQLLAARLPIEQTTQGWVRLFDGHTMFGWIIAGEANWRIEDGALVADRGKECLLTTSTRWSDYELELEFQSEAATNSGIFLRTSIDPKDPATDCIEVNIAPDDNPFPTGGIVKRKKGEAFTGDPNEWHTINMVCDHETVRVKIDDDLMCEINDAKSPRIGYIGLQFRSGKVSFRNIRVRPLELEDMVDTELTRWTRYDDMPGEININDENHLVVDGGKQQLESKETFGDFTLLADYKMDDPKSNSGIFFRSIPGDVMMGYECQVNNEIVNDNPLQPADCGAGGIFKRQDARIVAGEPGRWNSILLSADGSHFATWVNGLQVTDVYDDRKVDENPRRGLRLDPGTLIIQGHDETTKATYRKIAIKPLFDPADSVQETE
ncbi:3-keto-disaccharide hydrolase [Aporhodopirellula aestuarii]|uniref:DUF1080 domain-containing protein n=1 Tax=Aporhodopirellula aestuarii TaxID=2950107 RepID=A0ABT0U3P2_9BACT|nr:DUF1080 domain-containing protein [Aporhodopirellula aestuarii]MCM2371524.1 DUF1080 domain-containing protein [Aporhodopirellula aestuarii]